MSQSRTFPFRRHAQGPDAEAFAAIVRLHSQMVYGVGLRITGDAHHAADVAQETFFHLLQNAGRITGSLGGWLHQVATRRAIDLVRRDSSRRRREQDYAAQATVETDSWADLSPLVDEALSELDEASRDLIIRHFLRGETMVVIAAADGVSQPTVSRRVEQALAALREKLRQKGVLAAAGVLGGLLANSTAVAVPAPVMVELGKMSALSAGAGGVSAKAVLGTLTVKAASVALVVVVGGGAYFILKPADRPAPPAAPVAVPASTVPRANVGGRWGIVSVPQRPGRQRLGMVVATDVRTNRSPAVSNEPARTPNP